MEATPAPSGSVETPQHPADMTRVTHPSLLQTQGWSVALPLIAPMLFTGGGVVAARRRSRQVLIVAVVLMGVGIVLGALSIGSFYIPAEAAMIVAVVKSPRT